MGYINPAIDRYHFICLFETTSHTERSEFTEARGCSRLRRKKMFSEVSVRSNDLSGRSSTCWVVPESEAQRAKPEAGVIVNSTVSEFPVGQYI